MKEVYLLLYTRTSFESVQDSALLPRNLPYAVGTLTREFLDNRAAQSDRMAKNKEAALQRKTAKRHRVGAGPAPDLVMLDD